MWLGGWVGVLNFGQSLKSVYVFWLPLPSLSQLQGLEVEFLTTSSYFPKSPYLNTRSWANFPAFLLLGTAFFLNMHSSK